MGPLTFKILKSFKNAGVWFDFQNTKKIEFASKTLIYGFNGSGKSTLSRVFSSMQNGTMDECLPKKSEFELELSNAQKLKSDNLDCPFADNLLVFNQDFISRNIAWADGTAESITYISEVSVEKKAEYDYLSKQYQVAISKLDAAKEVNSKCIKTSEECDTKIAKSVRDSVPSLKYTQRYNRTNVRKDYEAYDHNDADLIEDAKLLQFQKLLAQSSPLPPLAWKVVEPNDLEQTVNRIFELLSETPGTIISEQLSKYPSMLPWLSDGLTFHKRELLDDCLLCGNSFSIERKQELSSVFDNAWQKHVEEIDRLHASTEKYLRLFRDFYSDLPKPEQFQEAERETVRPLLMNLSESIKAIGLYLRELCEKIELKRKEPTTAVVFSDTSPLFSLEDWRDSYDLKVSELMNLISKHNLAYEEFETQQKSGFEAVKKHVLAREKPERAKLLRAHLEASETLKTANEEYTKINQKYLIVQNELSNHGIAASNLNRLLIQYLGHADIQLKAVESGGYQLIRSDGNVAHNLSEGEKTALAFCYFLTLFGADGKKIKNIVAVIDDPISSLDTSAQTHAFSLLARTTKKCAQLILLTHNLPFMNMVKNDFRNHQRRYGEEKVISLLALECSESSDELKQRKTCLVNLDPLLVDYDNEYHYLFDLVYNAAESGKTTQQWLLPNATRKLLETFTKFCSPSESSFAGALMKHHDKLKDIIDTKALERLVQLGSHGSIDGFLSAPVLSVEEGIDAAKAAMQFIENLSKQHFKEMEKCVRK